MLVHGRQEESHGGTQKAGGEHGRCPAAPRHWKLTADQYQRMGETGILHEDDPVELLEGELYTIHVNDILG